MLFPPLLLSVVHRVPCTAYRFSSRTNQSFKDVTSIFGGIVTGQPTNPITSWRAQTDEDEDPIPHITASSDHGHEGTKKRMKPSRRQISITIIVHHQASITQSGRMLTYAVFLSSAKIHANHRTPSTQPLQPPPVLGRFLVVVVVVVVAVSHPKCHGLGFRHRTPASGPSFCCCSPTLT
jgi:hypothetical protein